MAGTEKRLDLALTVGKLEEQYPELEALLTEIGIENPDPEKTIPELASDLGVELSVIAMALQMSGYEVEGYVPSNDGYKSPLGDIMSVLFEGTYHGEELPQSDSTAPMLSHMEMAILRAQQEGRLPKTEKSD